MTSGFHSTEQNSSEEQPGILKIHTRTEHFVKVSTITWKSIFEVQFDIADFIFSLKCVELDLQKFQITPLEGILYRR